MRKHVGEKGVIGLLIVLIVALALAKYFFHWSIIDFLKSPGFIDVFSYLKKAVLLIWNKLLLAPLRFIWNEVIVGIFWKLVAGGYDILRHWVDSN